MAKTGQKKKYNQANPDLYCVSIQMTGTYRDWVRDLADHCRRSVSDLVDTALVEHARTQGYNVPPPLRRVAANYPE